VKGFPVSEDTRHDTRSDRVDDTRTDVDDTHTDVAGTRRDHVDDTRTDARSDHVDDTHTDARSDHVDDTRTDVAGTRTDVDDRRTDPVEGRRTDPTDDTIAPAPHETASTGPGASTQWNAYPGLLPDDDLGGYRQRWDQIQGRFIDEPRQSVREADDLIGEVTHRIVERFSSSRKDFEERWETDSEPTTEEMRQALQRYRDYFKRLVAT
jgi:hypothetical protein